MKLLVMVKTPRVHFASLEEFKGVVRMLGYLALDGFGPGSLGTDFGNKVTNFMTFEELTELALSTPEILWILNLELDNLS